MRLNQISKIKQYYCKLLHCVLNMPNIYDPSPEVIIITSKLLAVSQMSQMCGVMWVSPKALASLRCCEYCCTIHPHVSSKFIGCASKPETAKERRNRKKKQTLKSEAVANCQRIFPSLVCLNRSNILMSSAFSLLAATQQSTKTTHPHNTMHI